MEFNFTLPGLGKPESSRPKRVAEAIRNELSVLLLREVADPRLGSVSISQLIVTPDLKQAKVYFVLPVGSDPKQALQALKKARGFFRTRLAKTLNLRYTPELFFYYDRGNEDVDRMEKLFRKIAEDRQKNASRD